MSFLDLGVFGLCCELDFCCLLGWCNTEPCLFCLLYSGVGWWDVNLDAVLGCRCYWMSGFPGYLDFWVWCFGYLYMVVYFGFGSSGGLVVSAFGFRVLAISEFGVFWVCVLEFCDGFQLRHFPFVVFWSVLQVLWFWALIIESSVWVVM